MIINNINKDNYINDPVGKPRLDLFIFLRESLTLRYKGTKSKREYLQMQYGCVTFHDAIKNFCTDFDGNNK